MNLKIISAGAGSGKTYRLTNEMANLLSPDADGKTYIRAAGILATTFTEKAAAELNERVKVKLLERGLSDAANDLSNALIGTVHSIGVKLLKRFAFEAGVSPSINIIAEEDQDFIFNQSLTNILSTEIVEELTELSARLGFDKGNKKKVHDFRKDIRKIIELARSNDINLQDLEASKQFSIETFLKLLPDESKQSAEYFDTRIGALLKETIQLLENNDDKAKGKNERINELKNIYNNWQLRKELFWYEWVAVSKTYEKITKKSQEDVKELGDFAHRHDTHPHFRKDIVSYISFIFDIGIQALEEYENYKKKRGLIDYTDMETHILRLLEKEEVRNVLASELDLLLVDEFQDTSPIQLLIFLKLSKLAKQAIWVGDPKQSIYGFRGAAPELMDAVVKTAKEIDVLDKSWRSRADLVNSVNAIFLKAFPNMKPEHIVLNMPAHLDISHEPLELGLAMQQWHFKLESEETKDRFNKEWFAKAVARAVRKLIQEEKWFVRIKGTMQVRPLKPADIAILCKKNDDCKSIAKYLSNEGLNASIKRSGLLQTAEMRLVLACLKFILHPQDTLSAAEVQMLATRRNIEQIIDDRLAFLEKKEKGEQYEIMIWGLDNPFLQRLHELRTVIVELSSAEIMNLVLDEMDLRRIVVAWGNAHKRLDNIEALRSLALKYEDSCNRLHAAATLGGFLLWLEELGYQEKDEQSTSDADDAVQVMTYHKSKGLEWPIVVCMSMDDKNPVSVFGSPAIEDMKEEIDLDNPLADRLIRFWVNPYADQLRSTNLELAAKTHPFYLKTEYRSANESARLLYVGLTRARDYLVFPTSEKSTTPWLSAAFHANENIPTFQAAMTECPWVWNERAIGLRSTIYSFPKNMEYEPTSAENTWYLPPRKGSQTYETKNIDVEKENTNKVKANRIISYTNEFFKTADIEPTILTKLLDDFLCADKFDYDIFERQKIATEMIDRYRLGDFVKANELLAYSDKFHKLLEDSFSFYKIQKKLPIHNDFSGRTFSNTLDFALDTPKGRVLIQNSSYTGDNSRWRNKALELGRLLQLAAETLTKGGTFPQTWVHFPLEGGLVELVIEQEGN